MSDWSHLEGIDPELVRTIERDGDETLCVVLILRLPPDEGHRPRMEDFSTDDEWLGALRGYNAARIAQAIAPTKEAIRRIGIDPIGGRLGELVLFGKPRQMRQAVALPGVELACLDCPFPFEWEVDTESIAASRATSAP